MLARLLFLGFSFVLLGCTNLDDRHVFRFTIEGGAESVDNMKVKMGPGVNFDSGDTVYLPVEISHDVYGDDLLYFFEVENSNPSADVKLRVYIDEVLIAVDSTFTTSGDVPKITIEGVH